MSGMTYYDLGRLGMTRDDEGMNSDDWDYLECLLITRNDYR